MSHATGMPCLTCGRRMRKTRAGLPNTNTECGRCRQNTLARERRARQRELRRQYQYYHRNTEAGRLRAQGMARAAELGHRMSQVERDVIDTPVGYIAYCLDCDRYMVVDVEEPEKLYGSTQTETCGPRVTPAPRRSEYHLDWAVSAPSGEPADGEALGGSTLHAYLGGWE